MFQHELNVINNTIEKAEAAGLTRLIVWATGIRDHIQKELDAQNAEELKANAVLANVEASPVTLAPSEPVIPNSSAQPSAETAASVTVGADTLASASSALSMNTATVQPPVDNDHVAPGATQFTAEEIALNAATTQEPLPETAGVVSSLSSEVAATSGTVAPQPSPTVTE